METNLNVIPISHQESSYPIQVDAPISFRKRCKKHSYLVLTRRPGDVICIGDDIRLVVTAITRRSVRLAIDAPRSIPIFREELLISCSKEKELTPCD